jgi:hypothetical protein
MIEFVFAMPAPQYMDKSSLVRGSGLVQGSKFKGQREMARLNTFLSI